MKRTWGRKAGIALVATAIVGAGATWLTMRGTGSSAVPDAVPHATASTEAVLNFSHFRVGDRNVKSILADGDLVWVGTSGGVVRYDTRTDEHRLLDVSSGLLANGVFHLSKIDGRLAVGTYGGGLSLLTADGKGWETYNVPEGLADAFVYSVLQTKNGDVWIATWSGANRIVGGALKDPAKWETYTVENTGGGLPNDWVYALAQGPDGSIWMATEGGLARFDGHRWQHWKHDDGLGAPYELVRSQINLAHDPGKYSEHHARQKQEMGLQNVDVAYNPNYIVALAVASDGTVWCGTWGGGLARFDGKKWKNYTVSDGLPGNHVFMLFEDSRKRIWVGTNNGLARMEGESFVNFGTREGLFANNVFSAAAGKDGSFWIGSFGGVARVAGLL
ncbi:MAG: regulator [Betaproteobacteria bacterium]|nr:regulator [Betaproteobacteria bacterium]